MKYIKIFLPLFVLTLLSSCTFTENIYINEDGTGKFSLEMDGSAIMAMMPQDSLKNEKAMDSTFSFKSVFDEKKDSIAKLPLEQQNRLKKLENFNMRMTMLPETRKFMFTMFTDFKSVEDLQDAMSTMNEIQNMKGKEGDSNNPISALGSNEFGNNNSSLSYSYDGKKFTRKAFVVKKDLAAKTNDSARESLEMIYASSTYVIKYHFPKAVKKVSNTTAQYSEDRKTITIEYPFKEYIDTPDKLNFEVEFEK
jgi:hypothetical protein